MIQKRTVGVVGTGNVGVAAAYAMFLRGVAEEILLVDKDHARAEGEAIDLMHGQALVGRVSVRATGYEELSRAQVIVISAGANQKPGETRLDLFSRNKAIFRAIAGELDKHAPDAILVIATNPVDVLTYAMQALSARPKAHVIGTGTLLDTSRFRVLLADYYGTSPRSVHAYILGEHGDSEVPIWSNATIGGLPMLHREVLGKPYDEAALRGLFEKARDAAYAIIERKGYTNLAIGVVIAHIVDAILSDQKSIMPVSVRLAGEYGIEDVCLSLPSLVGMSGVERVILPQLDTAELAGLRRSADVLKERVKDLGL